MRLRIDLHAEASCSQRHLLSKYPISMNSYIYNILSKSEKFKGLHDKKRIKGFSFSNIHPIRDSQVKEKSHYKILISSPKPSIIETLFFGIQTESKFELGDASFTITSLSVEKWKLSNNDILETPVFLNVTKQDDGKIKPLLFNRERDEYLIQLQKNLLHKHNELTEEQVEIENLFQNVEIDHIGEKKEFALPIDFDTGRFTVIGNKLYFKFRDISDEQLKVFQTCFDAGFGERSSFGFGFMVKRK